MKIVSDRYNGAIVVSSTVPSTADEFEKQLIHLFSQVENKNLLWITLPIGKASYIPLLTAHGFSFYNCGESKITLVKRIAANPILPVAPNHTVNVVDLSGSLRLSGS